MVWRVADIVATVPDIVATVFAQVLATIVATVFAPDIVAIVPRSLEVTTSSRVCADGKWTSKGDIFHHFFAGGGLCCAI